MKININKVSSEDPAVVSLAKSLGEEPSAVASLINAERYRKAYNQQESVKAARKAYNTKRNAEMKVLREVLKNDPHLQEYVKGEVKA